MCLPELLLCCCGFELFLFNVSQAGRPADQVSQVECVVQVVLYLRIFGLFSEEDHRVFSSPVHMCVFACDDI